MLACLGDRSRFRLVLELLRRELCVSDLAREVGLSQSCTTRHLQFLQREGLVCGARDGKRVMFRLCSDQARARELLTWVAEAPGGSAPANPAPADSKRQPRGTSPIREAHGSGREGRRRPALGAPESKPKAARRAPDPVGEIPVESTPTPEPRPLPVRRNDMEDWLL